MAHLRGFANQVKGCFLGCEAPKQELRVQSPRKGAAYEGTPYFSAVS